MDPRAVCIIGVAQETTRPPGPAPEPLESWERVARAAAEDAGAPDALRLLESLSVVYCQSWQYDDPVGRLAERLDADPRHRLYSGIGGTTPQALLDDTAERMLAGQLDLALVVGAEALATKRMLKKQGERPAWSHRDPEKKPFPFEAVPHQGEIAHGVFQAWETFPLFDSARRAKLGVEVDAYRQQIAAMMAPLSAVAASNPHAWFPVAHDAAELATPTPVNRYVGWPYTKLEVSVLDVDMAAAVLVATAERADALGVPEDRRVYLRGWAYGTDPWNVAEREDMSRSPGMESVHAAALAMAGVAVEDLTALDLYSCFPSSLHFACDALGLDPLDPRGLTVTGGLPYAGGPASNYLLHSVASMAERLRHDGGHGLVTGVGMHMTKHVAGVYSTTPPEERPTPADGDDLQGRLDVVPRRPLLTLAEGEGVVVAYTVAHGRDGSAEQGLVVVDLPAGRALARVRDHDLLADAESRELVGHTVALAHDGNLNLAAW